MAGEINGTDCYLAVEAVPAGGTFAQVGGLKSNSFTLNNSVVDYTNKSSASWRALMAAEGMQSVDVTAEIVFNGDTNFTIMKTAALAKTALNYEIDRDTDTVAGAFIITSWAESSPDQEVITVSVSMSSTGAVTGL